MKNEQFSLFPPTAEDVHKQVIKELGRVSGEDWEDFNEVVRYEVNARLKELNSKHPIPDYKNSKIINRR